MTVPWLAFNDAHAIGAGVEIDHRFNSHVPDVRCAPNSGGQADVARGRGWVTCGLMRRSKSKRYSITVFALATNPAGISRPRSLSI